MRPPPGVRARNRLKSWLLLNLMLLIMVAGLSATYPVEELSRRFGDIYFRLRPALPASNSVGLVVIDDLSLSRYGRWPWPRSLLAQLVRATSAQKPAAIGLDILLAEHGEVRGDEELANALHSAGNVVLAAKLSSSGERLWVDPQPLFRSNAAGIGHVQAVEDSDGICRSVPLREMNVDGPRLALAVQVARTAGHEMPELTQSGSTGWQVYSPEYLTINFRKPFETNPANPPFVTVSAAELMDGHMGDRREGDGHGGASLQGKAVLIGFAATDLSDRLPTPVSGQMPMPGVEVHANLLDGILSGRSLRPAPMWPQILFLTLFCLFSTWMVLRWPLWNGILLQAAILGLSYAAGYWIFLHQGQMVDFGPVLCAGVLAVPLAQLWNLAAVDRGLTESLSQLRDTLQIGEAVKVSGTPHLLAWPEGSGDLQWRVEFVNRLQAELGSLYAFRQNLLESMQEGLAVFDSDGKVLFRNRCWDEFCRKQGWDPKLELGEFARLLGHPSWANVAERVRSAPARTGLAEGGFPPLESEVALKGSFWQVRGVHLPPFSNQADDPPGYKLSSQWMVVVTDLTSIQERDAARAEALRFVTHELRTPLVSIQGFAEYLLHYPQASGTPDAAATIFRESQRLVSLINTYLDVLRFDAGARSIRREPVSIPEIVAQVQRVMSPIAEAAKIRVAAEIQPKLPELQGDAPMLTGVLLNLLNNAVKYSPAGSQIRLRVSAAETTITFEVQNPGPVIPPEDLARLFEPFYRTPAADDSGAGWGLGLTFVKRIVEEHFGRLEADSGLDGIAVRVHLPVAPSRN
jgi:CHASE2 domain-containing sensor protein/signal transduction histidine kinase